MRLLDLLGALHNDIETVRKDVSTFVDDHYLKLSTRYTELAEYKLGEDSFTPGIHINDIKRKLKACGNTYYSIYTGLIDEEINRTSYNRQLGILAVQTAEMVDEVSSAFAKSTEISALMSLNVTPTTEDKAEPESVEAAFTPRDQNVMFQAVKEAAVRIDKTLSDIDQVEKADIEFLRKHQGAPSTPEGYQALQEKSRPDQEGYALLKKQHESDDSQKAILEQYQDSLQKLISTPVPSNSDWTIAKGPVFFNSKPPISELQIKGLKVKYSPFFPGWILEDQFLLGIKPALIKDKAKLLETLRFIQKALSQRFESGFVYMTVPTANLGQRAPGEGVELSEKTGESKTKQKIAKELQRVKRVEDVKTEIPKFTSLPGSKLLWTWMLAKNKYNALPRVNIRDFGFPMAASMRSLDERLAQRIIPDQKHDATKVAELAKQYRSAVEKEYQGDSKELLKKIEDAKEKAKAAKLMVMDVKSEAEREMHALEELKHDLSLSRTPALTEKLIKATKLQEDKLSILVGKANGLNAIAKGFNTELTSLKAQHEALITRINKEIWENMKKAQQGIEPDEKFALHKE